MTSGSIDKAAKAAVFVNVEMDSRQVGEDGGKFLVLCGVESKNFKLEKGGGDFGAVEVERETGLDAGHYVSFVFSQFACDGISGGVEES